MSFLNTFKCFKVHENQCLIDPVNVGYTRIYKVRLKKKSPAAIEVIRQTPAMLDFGIQAAKCVENYNVICTLCGYLCCHRSVY